jgi:ABC-type Fe3+ transport system substrate-binding protein
MRAARAIAQRIKLKDDLMTNHSSAWLSRRLALRMTALGIGSSILTASISCSPQQSGTRSIDDAIKWAASNLPNSTADIVRGAAKEGHLTLTMLNQGGNAGVLEGLIAAFNKRYPFIKVTYTAQSTLQLVNKFNAELAAGKGITDYLNLPPNLKTTNALARHGAILPFVISQDTAFPAQAKLNGFWYAWRCDYPATAYRKGALSEEDRKLIRHYEGLADPRFKNRIGVVTVENSATSAVCYMLLTKADPKIWQGLVDNRPRVKTSSSSLLDGLLAGEYDVALFGGMMPNTEAARQGAPVEFGVSDPFPALYLPAGISALAPHPNAAKLWQDWVMSAEGQRRWMEASGAATARNDVGEKAWVEKQPWFFKDGSRQIDIDWDDFDRQLPEVVSRFRKDIKRG